MEPHLKGNLAGFLDATLLTADARSEQIDALAHEAARLGCAAVCVNPVQVERAVRILKATEVRVASVAGFPLGASPASAKIEECRFALARGATELDIVIPIWAAVAGAEAEVEVELAAVLAATHGATRKLIVEVGLLPAAALEMVAAVMNRLRPEFVKTGTGYARPVTPEDVETLRRVLDLRIAIKAAGGVRTRAQAEALVRAGASRIGTSRAAELLA